MSKTLKTYLFLFGVMVLVITLLEVNKKQLIDWSLNYDLKKKSPFGLYILNQEIDVLLDNKLDRIYKPYDYLKDSRPIQNYFVIKRKLTESAEKHLLEKVKKGSNLFVADTEISDFLMTELNFRTEQFYSYDSKSTFLFMNKEFEKDSIVLTEEFDSRHIFKTEKKTTQVLAYMHTAVVDEESNVDEESIANEQNNASFIKIKHGEGSVYILIKPILFTNYYLKDKKNQKTIEALFSFLPKLNTVWFVKSELKLKSEFSYILNNKSLRSSWYLTIFLLLLFVLFNSKRKQRIIPIINPKKNKSVDFIKSIGNLYLQEGNVNDMALKKVKYFLYRIRTELYLNTDVLEEEFIHKLHLKTGKPLKDIEKAIALIKNILGNIDINEEELIKINRILDKIHI